MVTQTNHVAPFVGARTGTEPFSFIGKSTDDKPVLTSAENGSTFYEMDTRTLYMWDGAALDWVFQLSLDALFPKPPVPVESIELTVTGGEEASFIVYTAGRINGAFCPYAWTIDWGDGVIENHSGMGASGNGITHTYPAANTEYTVTITAQNPEEKGWLRALGFGMEDGYETAKLLAAKGELTENMIRTADTDKRVLESWFEGCEGLREIDLVLPQKLTAVGSSFATNMFARCNSLVSGAAKFFGSLVLPQAELDKSGVYSFTFEGCGITESLGSIPQLQQIPSARKYTFSGVSAASSLHANWR